MSRTHRLTLDDRKWLAMKILSELDSEPMAELDRYCLLVAKAECALGYGLLKTKDKTSTMIRRFVATRLIDEQYTYSQVGRLMGRSHSAVIELVRGLRFMISLPGEYQELLQQYKEFNQLVDEFDNG